jgi:Outer membrane protein beta-barrel domain
LKGFAGCSVGRARYAAAVYLKKDELKLRFVRLDVLLAMKLRKIFPALIFILVGAGSTLAFAQAAPSGYGRTFSATAGVMGSAFQPDYEGGGIPATSSNRLFGVGGYADLQFSRWFGLEAEGRWLRFNQIADIHESNYLLGYRLPVNQLRFWRLTPYGKVLIGYGRMTFEYNQAHGRFTDIAYGGGLDLHTGGRLTIRPVDFEYQQWPNWLGTTLHPWGFSAGIGYRIWGR